MKRSKIMAELFTYSEKILTLENYMDEISKLSINCLRPLIVGGVKNSYIGHLTFGASAVKVVFETPKFFSNGTFVQKTLDSHPLESREPSATLIMDKSFCDPWLENFMDTFGRSVYKEVLKQLPELVISEEKKGKIIPKGLKNIIEDGDGGYSSHMKNVFTNDVLFLKIMPQSLVFSQNVFGAAVVSDSICNLIASKSTPKQGMYKIRICPKHVFVGKLGESYGVNLKWTCDQVLFHAIEFTRVPATLAIGASDFFTEQPLSNPNFDISSFLGEDIPKEPSTKKRKTTK